MSVDDFLQQGRDTDFFENFGPWRSFDLCLSMKPDLLDKKCSFVFVDCFFSDQRLYLKTSEIWPRKELSLSCIRLACLIRFCTCSRNLMKVRLQDTSLPHFSKTLCSLCLILSWKAVVKSKTKFNSNLRRCLVFLYEYFLSSDHTIRILFIMTDTFYHHLEHRGGSPVASIGFRSGVHFPKDIPPFSSVCVLPFLLCPPILLLANLFVIFLAQKHHCEKLTFE